MLLLVIFNYEESIYSSNCTNITQCNLIGFEECEVVPDDFMLDMDELYKFTDIDLTSFINVNKIGDNFIYRCSYLTKIDLSSIKYLHSVGDCFLNINASLKHVKLTNIEIIGNEFINDCDLEEIDLSPLTTVVEIGWSFLSYNNLKRIDLSPLINIYRFPLDFLSYNYELESISFKGLSNITEIGGKFLQFNKSIKELDLSELYNLTNIGHEFLSQTKLRSVNLRKLTNLKFIDDDFMEYCDKLENIYMPDTTLDVRVIYKNFLIGCKSLRYVDMSVFSNVTLIKPGFLSECELLTDINSDLEHVEKTYNDIFERTPLQYKYHLPYYYNYDKY